MAKRIEWHFPRPDLARKYMDEFELGMTNCIAMFAERRTGKTEFVLRDVLPEASKQKYIPMVVDFWYRRESPEKCLLMGLNKAIAQLPARAVIKAAKATRIRSKVGLNPALDVEGEIPNFDDLNEAFSFIERAVGDDKGKPNLKLLLFLDEVQHLGTSESFIGVTSALRTFIDKNKGWLKVIMTGSSQEDLKRMFRQSNAPFYQMSALREFERLRTDFVAYTVGCYKKATGVELDIKAAVNSFAHLQGSPLKFQGLVKRMVLDGSEDFNATWQRIAHEYSEEETIAEEWERLSDVDSQVLVMIAMRESGQFEHSTYSIESMEWLQRTAALNRVSKSTIQNAISRLKKTHWISSSGHGVWKIEGAEKRQWLMDNAL